MALAWEVMKSLSVRRSVIRPSIGPSVLPSDSPLVRQSVRPNTVSVTSILNRGHFSSFVLGETYAEQPEFFSVV